MKILKIMLVLMLIPFISSAAENTAAVKKINEKKFVKSLILREKLVKIALSMQGTQYWYGSDDPDFGLDCSAFTQYVYSKAGIKIPRTAAAQYESAVKLIRASLQKGDLVFFSTMGYGANHVGIYIGNDRFIHAPSIGKVVTIESMDRKFYRQRFLSGGSYIY
jgi:cell wall-associated NlpC family hydrolase